LECSGWYGITWINQILELEKMIKINLLLIKKKNWLDYFCLSFLLLLIIAIFCILLREIKISVLEFEKLNVSKQLSNLSAVKQENQTLKLAASRLDKLDKNEFVFVLDQVNRARTQKLWFKKLELQINSLKILGISLTHNDIDIFIKNLQQIKSVKNIALKNVKLVFFDRELKLFKDKNSEIIPTKITKWRVLKDTTYSSVIKLNEFLIETQFVS